MRCSLRWKRTPFTAPSRTADGSSNASDYFLELTCLQDQHAQNTDGTSDTDVHEALRDGSSACKFRLHRGSARRCERRVSDRRDSGVVTSVAGADCGDGIGLFNGGGGGIAGVGSCGRGRISRVQLGEVALNVGGQVLVPCGGVAGGEGGIKVTGEGLRIGGGHGDGLRRDRGREDRHYRSTDAGIDCQQDTMRDSECAAQPTHR